MAKGALFSPPQEPDDEHREVVALFRFANELLDGGGRGVDDRLGAVGAHFPDRVEQTRFAEEVVLRVLRFGQAVGVQQKRRAGRKGCDIGLEPVAFGREIVGNEGDGGRLDATCSDTAQSRRRPGTAGCTAEPC